MRCTDCSKPVRPVVAVDIDGTIGDYHGHFFSFARHWLGQDSELYSSYDGSIDICSFMGLTKDVYRKIKLAYRQGGMKRTMPLIGSGLDHPAYVIQKMRDAGIEVWIATSRPYNRLDNIDPDTVEWLRRNGISYDGLLYDDNKVSTLMEIVGADRIIAMVDDLATVYDHAAANNLNPILMQTKYNNAVHRPCSVTTMGAAALTIQSAARQWRSRYEPGRS